MKTAKSSTPPINSKPPLSKASLVHLVQRCIVLFDEALNKQLNAIIHHKEFQRLEASWRGLYYLVEQVAQVSVVDAKKIKIRVLDVSWRVLAKDLLRAIEFDQSEIFYKVYSQEFDNPGGEPFGLLIGDYQIGHKTFYSKAASDLKVLELCSKVASAAFAPFVASVDPKMFSLDDFANLQSTIDLERIFQQEEYDEWKRFRRSDDARFVGLVLPKVLMRVPYTTYTPPYAPYTSQAAVSHQINSVSRYQANQSSGNYHCPARAYGFCFQEQHYTAADYLWGSAAYCFAAIVVRSFGLGGWFTEICGVEQDKTQRGVVTGLARHFFSTDRTAKDAVNIHISEQQEKALSELGFISLCECRYTMALNAFYSCRSVQQSKIYDREHATSNAEISSMLHYMLCVSRFAHYIKIMVRDKIGSFATSEDCERYLEKWILQYTANGENLTAEFKAKYPLREAKIKVQEEAYKSGKYLCFMHLRPHYQMEQIESQLELITELGKLQ